MIRKFGMMMMLTLLCSSVTALAQRQSYKSNKIQLSGKVTNFQGTPLKDVAIFIDSTQTEEKTNKKGQYKVKIDEGTKWVSFYSPLFGIYDVYYTEGEELDFAFPEEKEFVNKDELKKRGYAMTKRRKVYGAGEINFEDDPALETYTSIFQLLKNRFAGVVVSGETVSIRGSASSSLNTAANNQPLFVVNGSQVSSIAGIPPQEVKSIKVLKSSEAGRYGTQGANGVLIIDLK